MFRARLTQAELREIMVITGDKSVSEASRYTRAVEQAKLAEQATAS